MKVGKIIIKDIFIFLFPKDQFAITLSNSLFNLFLHTTSWFIAYF
jgi:hypothetical protein